ncbi:MAG: ABC transporter ATP-binding protein [Gemmatimonadales bacterium]|nr:ABC transporter ATP-binding protein [Gemmatimonadales bacterium]
MLELDVRSRRGGFALEAGFHAPAGSTTVIVGESGAGKTTLLRLAAGLDQPDRGRIVLDGVVYAAPEAGIAVPPWRRDVGYVPQDYALFPHLTVEQNVAFGLRAQRARRRTVAPRVTEALRRAGIADLGRRRPSMLSGGQQQRAALARALVLDPRLLLLDEPLAALDLQTRRLVRGELRDLLRALGCVTLYVTHSPLEALLFGDRIVVIESGRVSQTGTRDDLLRYPRSRYVAELMGTNLFAGSVGAERAAATVRTGDGDLAVSDPGAPGDVFLTVDPRDITIHAHAPEGSAQNVFAGPIVEMAPEPPSGERVRVVLGTRPALVAEVTREAVAGLGLREGMTVHASFKATGIRTYR